MSSNKAKGNGRWTPVNRTARQEGRRWRRYAFRLHASPGDLSLLRQEWAHGLGFRARGGR